MLPGGPSTSSRSSRNRRSVSQRRPNSLIAARLVNDPMTTSSVAGSLRTTSTGEMGSSFTLPGSVTSIRYASSPATTNSSLGFGQPYRPLISRPRGSSANEATHGAARWGWIRIVNVLLDLAPKRNSGAPQSPEAGNSGSISTSYEEANPRSSNWIATCQFFTRALSGGRG